MEGQTAGTEAAVRDAGAQESKEPGLGPWTGRGLRASPSPSGPGRGRKTLGLISLVE